MDPFILLSVDKFEPKKDSKPKSNPLMSLVIFEWQDEGLIGQYQSDDKDRVSPKKSRLSSVRREAVR